MSSSNWLESASNSIITDGLEGQISATATVGGPIKGWSGIVFGTTKGEVGVVNTDKDKTRLDGFFKITLFQDTMITSIATSGEWVCVGSEWIGDIALLKYGVGTQAAMRLDAIKVLRGGEGYPQEKWMPQVPRNMQAMTLVPSADSVAVWHVGEFCTVPQCIVFPVEAPGPVEWGYGPEGQLGHEEWSLFSNISLVTLSDGECEYILRCTLPGQHFSLWNARTGVKSPAYNSPDFCPMFSDEEGNPMTMVSVKKYSSSAVECKVVESTDIFYWSVKDCVH